jgi:hypothetical protein
MYRAPSALSVSMTGRLIALAAALAVATAPGVGGRALDVTAGASPHSIWLVMSWTAKLLTKRRAVDFCHVATAICPRPAA